MKIIYTFLFIAFIIISCNSKPSAIASTDSAYKTEVPQTPVINAEIYTGTLPCADCEGIDVSLQLNNDSSYVMNSVYKGSRVNSNNNSFKDAGTWSIRGMDTLYLSTKQNVAKYIKTDSTLIQLDGNGNRITGPLAENFVLHKK